MKSLIGSRIHSGISSQAAVRISCGSRSKSPTTAMTWPTTAAIRCTNGVRKSNTCSSRANSPPTWSAAQPVRRATALSSQARRPASAATSGLARSRAMKVVTRVETVMSVVVSQVPANTIVLRTVAITSSTEGRMPASAARFSAALAPPSISSTVVLRSSLRRVIDWPRSAMKAGGISSRIVSTAALTGSHTGRVWSLTQSHASPALAENQPTMPPRLSPSASFSAGPNSCSLTQSQAPSP